MHLEFHSVTEYYRWTTTTRWRAAQPGIYRGRSRHNQPGRPYPVASESFEAFLSWQTRPFNERRARPSPERILTFSPRF
jgi:hypothetical protein